MGLLDGQPQQAQTPDYHCIVRHPGGSAILLVPDQGRWSLPRVAPFTGPREFLPDDVLQIGQAASQLLGARLTVLRHLVDAGPVQLCELETISGVIRPPAGAGWGTISDMQRIQLSCPRPVRDGLVRWWKEQDPLLPLDGGGNDHERRMWEQPGWLASTERWMRAEAMRRGAEVTGPAEQIKGGWCVSSVLRLPTNKGRIYFKESWPRPPAEGRVIGHLAQRWARLVPSVLATTSDGFGLLMRDFGSNMLTTAPDELWTAAVKRFAEMQFAEAASAARWRTLGCPDLRPRHLPGHLKRILDDQALTLSGPQALAQHELSTLRDSLPRIAELCERLEKLPVPASFHHEDFRAGNIAVVPGEAAQPSFVYFDWAWTALSHPFFSLAYFLTRGLPRFGMPVYDWRIHHEDQKRKSLCQAYLEPWTALAEMPRLWEALLLARQLNTVYRVVTICQSLPMIEPRSPWWEASAPVIPRFLRYIVYQLALLDQLGPQASSPFYVPA
jgi:hypothetical protein